MLLLLLLFVLLVGEGGLLRRGGGDLVDGAIGGSVRPPDEIEAGGRVREEEEVAWGEIGDVALLNRCGRESKYSSKRSKKATYRC